MKEKIVNLINSKFKGKDVGIGILDCISEKEDVEELADDIVKLFSIPDVVKRYTQEELDEEISNAYNEGLDKGYEDFY